MIFAPSTLILVIASFIVGALFGWVLQRTSSRQAVSRLRLAMNREVTRLQDRLDQCTEELTAETRSLGQARNQGEELRVALAASESECARLEEELARLPALEASVKRLSNGIRAGADELRRLRTSNGERTQALAALQASASESTTELRATELKLNETARTLAEAQAQNQRLEEGLAVARRVADVAREQVDALAVAEQRVRRLEAQLRTLRGDRDRGPVTGHRPVLVPVPDPFAAPTPRFGARVSDDPGSASRPGPTRPRPVAADPGEPAEPVERAHSANSADSADSGDSGAGAERGSAATQTPAGDRDAQTPAEPALKEQVLHAQTQQEHVQQEQVQQEQIQQDQIPISPDPGSRRVHVEGDPTSAAAAEGAGAAPAGADGAGGRTAAETGGTAGTAGSAGTAGAEPPGATGEPPAGDGSGTPGPDGPAAEDRNPPRPLEQLVDVLGAGIRQMARHWDQAMEQAAGDGRSPRPRHDAFDQFAEKLDREARRFARRVDEAGHDEAGHDDGASHSDTAGHGDTAGRSGEPRAQRSLFERLLGEVLEEVRRERRR